MAVQLKNLLKRILPGTIRSFLSNALRVRHVYGDYLFGNGIAGVPMCVDIEVTYVCNCRCKMCPLYGIHTDAEKNILETRRDSEKELGAEDYRKLLCDLSAMGVKNVHFTGGEPFLRKDILDIVQIATGLGLGVGFTTNGALLTEDIAKDIVAFNVETMCLSLDGCEETHNFIREADVYGPLMRAIDYLKAEKIRQNKTLPNLSLICTLSALNEHDMQGVVRIAQEKGLPLNIYPIIYSTKTKNAVMKKIFSGESLIKPESHLLCDSIVDVDVDALSAETEKAMALVKKMRLPVTFTLRSKRDIFRWFKRDDYFFVNKCFYPWYAARINPYGDVYPCSISINLGNIRNAPFADIWNGKPYVEFRRKLKRHRAFPFCSKCCKLYPVNKIWNYLP